MTDDIKNSLLGSLIDRAQEPFFLSFGIATVSYNWKALYLLVRPSEVLDSFGKFRSATTAEVWAMFDEQWHGFLCPFFLALAVTLTYPIALAGLAAFRQKVFVKGQNWIKQINYGEHVVLQELRHRQDYQRAVKNEDAIKIYLPQPLKRVDPQRPGGTLTTISECPDIIGVPRFMLAAEANNIVRRITRVPEKPDDILRTVFAFDNVGDNLVLCAEHQGMFPWPAKYADSYVLALDPNTMDILPVEQGTLDNAYPARALRQQDPMKHLARLVVRGKVG